MILIVGASSTIGREAIRLLRAAGCSLRLSSRTPEKLERFQDEGVEIVQADLLDKASLRRACEGAEKVLATTHSILGRGKNASSRVDVAGNRNLIDVACEYGVKHFVFMSALGANPDHPAAFFRYKAQTENYLKQSGLSYTILRPSAFFVPHTILRPRAFFEPDAELNAFLKGSPASIMGKGETLRNFIANGNVAQFAVIALTDAKAVNQTIEIGGPENLTAKEVAAIYAQVTGHNIKITTIPLFVPRLMHVLLKPFHPGLSEAMKLAVEADMTPAVFDVTPTLEEYPVELTKLEDWVRQKMTLVNN